MEWIYTDTSICYKCDANDGTNLGWVHEDSDFSAYVCDGYKGSTYLGHYKTPRLAQMAVERELLKRWFGYVWRKESIIDNYYIATLYVNERPLYTCRNDMMHSILARAKREFLSEL